MLRAARRQDHDCSGGSGEAVMTPRCQPAGKKDDASKARYDLIPPQALHLIVKAFSYGAEKYSDDGWMLVSDWRKRYFAASMRHLWAWWRGEKFDPESGLPSLAMAGACIFILLGHEVGENVDAKGEASNVHD